MDCFFCTTLLQAIGAAYLALCGLRFLNFVRLNWFAKLNIKARYAKAGSWAVVTGASDGIGLAMATDLARRGLSVVLIARNKAKLDEAAAAIKAKYSNVETKVIVFDFAEATPLAYKKLANEIEPLEVAVLVNNVGVNYQYPREFAAVPVEEDLRIITVNCESQVRMTKMVLPHMKARRAGAIINLSSFSALHPTALLATYAASKGFNGQFSESLAAEVKSFGIDVLSVTPNLVVSNMSAGVSTQKPRKSFLMVDANEMARATINKLGATTTTDGHPHHAIIESILQWLPSGFVTKQLTASQFATKKKAEKKLAKAQ